MSGTVSRSAYSPSYVHLFRGRATPSSRAPATCVMKTASSERGKSVSGSPEGFAPGLLKKPAVAECVPEKSAESDEITSDDWTFWENRILEETVPLVGFVRTIIHSGKYKVGDTLNPEHQKVIIERLLPYHPQYEEKIGSGVESITVGFHTEFKATKCLFIIHINGGQIDFSYWKCVKGLIRAKYPLHADAFIFRHFRRHRRNWRPMKE